MSCGSFELEISALVDVELEAGRLLAVVDHLAACRACRRFYQDARTLDALVAPAGGETRPAPETWERIAAAVAPPRRTLRPLPRWALAAAAALAGALALWSGLRVTSFARSPDQVDVALSSNPGAMSDRRFVQLTVELLEADPRYRRAMLAVLREIAGGAAGEDSSADVWVAGNEAARAAGDRGDAQRSSPAGAAESGDAGATRL